ncbi:MAG: isocitrate lyase/phosphoenolpyruvate mutase family protein [Bacteroidota bacterium]|nr:isocitrate lyase/phosphoenolpyruvate mutase family protein [Bacteroidota bacterium]
MVTNIPQKEKAERFRHLHHTGKMLVMPNIWDTLGALLLESLEYPAVATASASVAFSNGYDDGENIPFNDLLSLLKKITIGVNIPVTADIESGYADNDLQLQENIKLLIGTGIAGINFEDTDTKTNNLRSIESQCNKIKLIRKASDEMDIPLFINARTDVYLYDKNFVTAEAKFNEIIKRGLAYKESGADGFFPIALRHEEEIKELIVQVNLPINILTIPEIPDLKTLSKLGVARISLGSSLLKISIRAMKELAIQLKEYEGLSSVTGNEITTDYLKNLVDKNY